jgi:hypothetical protein
VAVWRTNAARRDDNPLVRLFHYHLVSSDVRNLEARYVGKLGFGLVARYGRIRETNVSVEPGTSWGELDREGFKLRLSELERSSVNIVLQPGHWRLPRVDHIGVVLDEDGFQAVLAKAAAWNLPVQERGGRRTFVSTNAGYRIEVHPPRDWMDGLLEAEDEFRLSELQLTTDRPTVKATALADILGVPRERDAVEIGGTVVRFLPGGPEGRPELHAERFARRTAGAAQQGQP